MDSTTSATGSSSEKTQTTQDPNVNYDEPALMELELDGVEYRIDPGKQGTALCISLRTAGSWDWSFVSEARWDGSMLRAKSMERLVLLPLSTALKAALEALE